MPVSARTANRCWAPSTGCCITCTHTDRRPLYDIVSGSNKYYPNVPGRRAHRGYDLASGLGVPQFATIAKELPGPAG